MPVIDKVHTCDGVMVAPTKFHVQRHPLRLLSLYIVLPTLRYIPLSPFPRLHVFLTQPDKADPPRTSLSIRHRHSA